MIINIIHTNEKSILLRYKRAFWWIALSGALALPLLTESGCSQKEKTLSKIRSLFEAGEYHETIAHCRHALKRNYQDGEVYYYYGLALTKVGRDYEAFRQLDRAVEIAPALAGAVASTLMASGKRAYAAGSTEKAKRRMKAAVTYNPAVELGVYLFIVGDAFFESKDYQKAARYYDKAVNEFPGDVSIERALYQLAVSYEKLGLEERSGESLEKLIEMFPRGEFAGEAKWKRANLLYEKGERELANGNFEIVVEVIGDLLTLTTNATLLQKARFLRGQAYEGLGDFRSAYEEYRAVIRQDRGASGRIVERAQEKIAVLREVGLFKNE